MERGLARELWRGRAKLRRRRALTSLSDARRIAERARTVVVLHQSRGGALSEGARANARVEEIPHLFSDPPLPGVADALRYRQRSASTREPVRVRRVGTCASPAHPIRAGSLRRGPREFRTRHWLIAGEFVSPTLELFRGARFSVHVDTRVDVLTAPRSTSTTSVDAAR